ncbi:MAG: RNA polymerase factor sigma-54 [Bacteroidales bacterium]|nr:RNA polymerase factor sigma-54 [Bacteroidales bacterium]
MIGQQQKMKMQQKLSPQQLMLMQMLQLPVTELEQTLKEEVEKNPLLEITDEAPAHMESLPDAEDGDNLMQDSDDDDYSYRERQERDRNQDRHEMMYVAETSFVERLTEQLALKPLTDRQRIIAGELIGSLDDAGYLSRGVSLIANDMAFTQGLEVSDNEVLEVLKVVQSLDPAGIGARTLQECLSLQLHRQAEPDASPSGETAVRLATRVVDNCFDDFVKHNYDRIAERLDINEEQLQEAIDCIRSLNPKPGMGDGETAQAHYIIPDFIVTRMDETLHLALNDSHLPQLKLDAYYQDMLKEMKTSARPTAGDKEAIEYLQTNLDNANSLIETLRQRQVTMLRVMQAIMRRQKRFFLTGDNADLKPLLQKDVAEQTGYDISTVSRVVNSKYVQTEFGTFLLKDCFSQGITTESGDEVSTEAIRQELQQLVDNEDKRNPLTDDELAQRLNENGYPVARRTVAKYRERMGIPIGRLRRMLKVLLPLLLLGSGMVQAQAPQKESYFDSIINSRIREGERKTREANNPRQKDKKTQKSDKARPALEIHEPEPDPTAIDSALAAEDELIDIMYDASIPPPSMLWYGRDLSGTHVRLKNLSMDSLPDEISIRLLKGDEKFCFPVKNIITSPYGWRFRWNRPHRGVDIRLNTGDPVRSAFNGVVRIARPMGAYGNLVVVRHYNGLETVYGHLSKIKVKPLQVVRAGQVLGLGGSTGRSTGPHLHFEVRFQYEPFDPEWILDFTNYTLRTRKLYLDKTYFGIRRPKSGETLEFKADKSIVPEAAPIARSNRPIHITAREGDSLETIAERNKTTVDALKKLNPDLKKVKKGVKVRVR